MHEASSLEESYSSNSLRSEVHLAPQSAVLFNSQFTCFKSIYLHHPSSLLHRYQTICLNSINLFDRTIRPMNLQISVYVLPQSKMKSSVIYRIKARLRHHRLCLLLSAIPCNNLRTACTAIGMRPDKKDLEPPRSFLHIIPKQ